MSKIIGIDLGTEFLRSNFESGKPKIIENSEGDRTTPLLLHIQIMRPLLDKALSGRL